MSNQNSTTSQYQPPKVWVHEPAALGGTFGNINRPTAGATFEKMLPVGKHPLQLYSLATPNGVKVTVMLEELLALGIEAAEYDAFLIQIQEGDQFSSGFVEVNPNSKIPALLDRSAVLEGKSKEAIRVFESGNILLYLAEKFDAFLPRDIAKRTECLSWLFWQMGSAPYLGGGFGHFYHYAPVKLQYPIDRFTLEIKRQLDLLNTRLSELPFVAGQEYSIADIAIWPWYGALVQNEAYDAAEFLDVQSYPYLLEWAQKVGDRPAVKRGKRVNKTWGEPKEQVPERHQASDIK